MVRVTDNAEDETPKTTLIEFKVQDTLIRREWFFENIRIDYALSKETDAPRLEEKSQVFATEKDALDLYREVASLGIKVVIVAWQSPTGRLRAQYVDQIVTCNTHTPGRQGSGSGTPQYNTHIDSYEDIEPFFEREFGIRPDVLEAIRNDVLNAGTRP